MIIRYLIFLSLSVVPFATHAAPSRTSLEVSGVVFPCLNCEFTQEGLYRIVLDRQDYLLRPFEAREKLFLVTKPDQIAKLNKTGDLLRFLLSYEIKPEEAVKAIQALLATDSGRSTFVLSFESIYRSHQRAVLRLLVSGGMSGEMLESIKRAPVASQDMLLELTLLALSGKTDLLGVVERQLDRDLSTTLSRITEIEQLLAVEELEPVAGKLLPALSRIKEALGNTSGSKASAYSEAGLSPELRKLMRKQRLLTLTSRAFEVSETEEAREVLKELTSAWDPSLDTAPIHEAFRHLIGVVPDAVAIIAPIKDRLVERDTTIQLMLNPPPPLEYSLIAVGITLLLIIIGAIVALSSWKTRVKVSQRFELRDGLSFDERRELRELLEKFDLSGDVTLEELKLAFRKKAKEHHPDKQSSDSGENFIELQKAYTRAKELIGAFGR
jgi:hypothetical protein